MRYGSEAIMQYPYTKDLNTTHIDAEERNASPKIRRRPYSEFVGRILNSFGVQKMVENNDAYNYVELSLFNERFVKEY